MPEINCGIDFAGVEISNDVTCFLNDSLSDSSISIVRVIFASCAPYHALLFLSAASRRLQEDLQSLCNANNDTHKIVSSHQMYIDKNKKIYPCCRIGWLAKALAALEAWFPNAVIPIPLVG